jgi:hypothetical protein
VCRPQLEPRCVELERAQDRRLAEKRGGGQRDARPRHLEPEAGSPDVDAFQLGLQQGGHDVEAAEAGLRAERGLQPPLDGSPQGILGEETEADQQQQERERAQADPAREGHRSQDDSSR